MTPPPDLGGVAEGAWRPGRPSRCSTCGSTTLSYEEDGTAKCLACGAFTLPTWSEPRPAIQPAPPPAGASQIRFVNPPSGPAMPSGAAAPWAPYPVTPPTGQRMSAARRNRIAVGAILLAIGLLVTAGTYGLAATNPSGGTYFVAYGPAIIGAYLLITGLVGRGIPRRRT